MRSTYVYVSANMEAVTLAVAVAVIVVVASSLWLYLSKGRRTWRQEPRKEEETKRQVVHEGGGEVEREVEREGEGGVGPDPDSQQRQPAGHTEYSLLPEMESNPIQSEVQITETFLVQARDNFQDIDQRYNEVLDKRKEINTLLNQFKEKLGLQASANFPACFRQLRTRVGDWEHLELSRDEPLQIILGEGADGIAQEAVEIFNSMLQKCRELPAEVEAATAYMKEKMQAIQKESLQTEKIVRALEKSNASLQQLCNFDQDINTLIQDVKWARGDLESRKVPTGMHPLRT